MIEKVIVIKALKAEKLYLPGEVVYPPFSVSIEAEIKAGRGVLHIVHGQSSDQHVPPKQSVDAEKLNGFDMPTIPDIREILFRKFERMDTGQVCIVKPQTVEWASPPWFTGRYAKKYKQLLFRKIEWKG